MGGGTIDISSEGAMEGGSWSLEAGPLVLGRGPHRPKHLDAAAEAESFQFLDVARSLMAELFDHPICREFLWTLALKYTTRGTTWPDIPRLSEATQTQHH